MLFARLISLLHLPAKTPAERSVLKVQMAIVCAASVLLTVGYAVQRQMRTIILEDGLQLILRGWDGVEWFVWPLAAPAMLILIRRFPLTRGMIRQNLVRLIVWSIALYLLVTNLRFLLRALPNLWLPDEADLPIDWPNYAVTMIVLLPLDFLTYCGFLSASFAVDYYFKNRRRAEEALQLKLRAAQLESDLAQAELKALRGQLHPHFLFNSFNAVTMLMRQGRNDAAVEVIAQLSALLRLAIERTGRHQLSLEEEMDFVRRYLEVERIRFGEKLLLQIQVDPLALGAAVPNLVLQPLVENAIKHGISRRTAPGRLRIEARRRADWIEVEIENDGVTAAAAAGDVRVSTGIGLSNTRARLEKIYGPDYRFEMEPRPDGGMHVRLDLPCKAALQRSCRP